MPTGEEIDKWIAEEKAEIVDSVGKGLKALIKKNKGQFQETIPIKPDGQLEVMDKYGARRWQGKMPAE